MASAPSSWATEATEELEGDAQGDDRGGSRCGGNSGNQLLYGTAPGLECPSHDGLVNPFDVHYDFRLDGDQHARRGGDDHCQVDRPGHPGHRRVLGTSIVARPRWVDGRTVGPCSWCPDGGVEPRG
jgi:hypothetical protein